MRFCNLGPGPLHFPKSNVKLGKRTDVDGSHPMAGYRMLHHGNPSLGASGPPFFGCLNIGHILRRCCCSRSRWLLLQIHIPSFEKTQTFIIMFVPPLVQSRCFHHYSSYTNFHHFSSGPNPDFCCWNPMFVVSFHRVPPSSRWVLATWG